MVTSLLGTLAAAIVFIVMSSHMASANHAAAQQALYAADAAIEETVTELRTVDWRTAPGTFVSTRLADGAPAPRAPDGTTIDAASLTRSLQAASDARYGAATDRPVWRLAGRAPFSDLLPGLIVPPAYLLVWVADDAEERDGDPARDTNGVVLIRAQAFGAAAAHRSIEAGLELEAAAAPPRREVRILFWREIR